jgi:hypothetical protein
MCPAVSASPYIRSIAYSSAGLELDWFTSNDEEVMLVEAANLVSEPAMIPAGIYPRAQPSCYIIAASRLVGAMPVSIS